MTTFPSAIDAFAVVAPNDIIRAVTTNSLAQSIVAIEVFTLSTQQALTAHITDAIDAHTASAIAITTVSGLAATNVQDALTQIKALIDTINAGDVTLAQLNAHIANDINLAHPNGLLLGTRIAQSTISQSQLNFSVATYGVTNTNQDLAYHESLPLSSAHPGPINSATDISNNSITENKLAFVPALESELQAHIAASGTSISYAILASSTITSTGNTIITGSVGLSPGTAITGFPPGTISGTEDKNNSNASTALAAAQVAYNTFVADPAGTTISVLDGQTLTPGTYTSTTSMSLATSANATLTLNGAGTYIFQIGTTLVTGAGGIPTITLENGASAANIYWLVGSSATLNSGYSGIFQGNVIANASITVTLGGTINGSLTALTGAVTLSAATNIVALGSNPTYAHVATSIEVLPTVDGYSDVQDALAGLYGTIENHILADSGVHGVAGNVVGTTDTQLLTNKTIVSAFVGSKIVLFTGPIEPIEQLLPYAVPQPPTSSDAQLTIRNPAATLVTAQVIASATVPVVNPGLFNSGDTVTFYVYPNYNTTVTSTVLSTSSNTITLTSTVSLLNQSAAVNTSRIINPLFSVDATGSGIIQNLHVKNTTLNDAQFQDNLDIGGNLSVVGNTNLGTGNTSTVTISGATTIGGAVSIAAALSATGQATVGSFVSTGNATIGGSLVVTGLSSLGAVTATGPVNILGNLIVDGYGLFNGTVTGQSFVSSNGIYDGINLPELNTAFENHITAPNVATPVAHPATAISVVPFNNMVAGSDPGGLTTVQAALQEWNPTGDLVDQVFTLSQSASLPTNITGLSFNPAVVRSAHVEYSIYRYYTSPATEIATVGTLRIVFKNNVLPSGIWLFDDGYAGDSPEITFSVTPAGQVQYTSTAIAGTVSSDVMHFRARVTLV